MPNYGLINSVKASGESIAAIMRLQKGDKAISLLPPDTKFAVVIEAIQRGINDTFWETDTNVATMSGEFSAEGIVGRFIGYLAFTDSKVRIYQALDENAVASGQPTADFILQGTGETLQLLMEEEFANMAVSLMQGEFVLSNSAQKFKLLQPYPISHLDGRFESSATGFYNGLSPALKFMQAHGVQTQGATQQVKTLWIIFVVIFVAATASVILLSRHH